MNCIPGIQFVNCRAMWDPEDLTWPCNSQIAFPGCNSGIAEWCCNSCIAEWCCNSCIAEHPTWLCNSRIASPRCNSCIAVWCIALARGILSIVKGGNMFVGGLQPIEWQWLPRCNLCIPAIPSRCHTREMQIMYCSQPVRRSDPRLVRMFVGSASFLGADAAARLGIVSPSK